MKSEASLVKRISRATNDEIRATAFREAYLASDEIRDEIRATRYERRLFVKRISRATSDEIVIGEE